jgi:ubiquinone/menaquinone biosynthesis C-methylase UbiE
LGDLDFWDQRAKSLGHTGYSDQILYRYDQPLRVKAIQRATASLGSHFKEERSALDIGCGVGDIVSMLADEGFAVTGVDFSREVLSLAAKRFRSSDAVKLLHADLRTLNLPGLKFDVITSVTVLQHITDDSEVVNILSKLGTLQKKGGLFIILESAPIRVGRRWPGLAAFNPLDPDRPPVKLRSRSQWVCLFRGGGYSFLQEYYHPQIGTRAANLINGVCLILFRRKMELPKRFVLTLTKPFDGMFLPLPERLRHTRILTFIKV